MKQLSIFIENKRGTLLTVLNVLKGAGIQIIASRRQSPMSLPSSSKTNQARQLVCWHSLPRQKSTLPICILSCFLEKVFWCSVHPTQKRQSKSSRRNLYRSSANCRYSY